MDCPVCWDKFENSAFSLNCGHLFHRKCIEALVNTRSGHLICPLCRKKSSARFRRRSIREVFFTSTTSPSEPSSIPGSHKGLRAEMLKEQQRAEAKAKEFEDLIFDLAQTKFEEMADAVGDQLCELEFERRRWKRQWKESEKEVARLESELREVRQERDSSRKNICKVKVKADISQVSIFITSE